MTGDAEPVRLLTVADVCRTLQCGKSFVYALLQTQQLKAVKLGRLRRIPASALDEFIAQTCGESAR